MSQPFAAGQRPTNEDEFRLLVEHGRFGLYRIDVEGVLVHINARGAELLGHTPEELLGRHFHEFHFEKDLARARDNFARRLAGENGVSEYRMRRKDGTAVWIAVSSVPVFDDKGTCLGLAGFASDINERKRHEEIGAHERRLLRLIASDKPLQEILDDLCRTLQSLASRPLRCVVLLADEEHDRLTCISAPSMPQRFREDDSRTIANGATACALALSTRQPVIIADIEEPGISEDVLQLRREYAYGAIWSHPIVQDGCALGTLAFLPDQPGVPDADDTHLIEFGVEVARLALTHEAARTKLARSEANYRQLLQMNPLPVWIFDLETLQLLEVSEGACALTGFAREELLSRRVIDMRPPEEREAFLERVRGEAKGRHMEIGQWHTVRKDGSRILTRISWGRVDYAGRPAVIAFLQDVTEQVRAEARIRELNASLEERVRARTAELEAANQELDAFNYSVSHDLRAPLRTIDGFSQALLEDHASQLDETGLDYLRRISAAVRRMGDLIDAMYHLSRLGRSLPEVREVNLSALAGEIVAELRQAAPRLDVDVVIAPDLSAEGDPGLLRAMLENLLGNAWKYTSRTARARIELGLCKDGSGAAVYFVRDNGAGFDMAFSDKLFKLFQRLHRDDEFDGQGVGLATVQRIVRRHGGRVWAEAEKGRGATFYFTLWDDTFLRRERKADFHQHLA